ncbi:ATP-grasp domain-containing protein [Bacteroides gallinaceum]|uniref:ATP-grasp domain-containing protein n=1 Tax=Bacteroides gallinaceum TaxID=1462571 RepID=UPI0019573FA7|nr:ATP-grasp domain-containing protein [Bacteroides gallinaceum]MBM6944431.1 ATP-grasp domain-containing protein [Bacteroides gallinaceum]
MDKKKILMLGGSAQQVVAINAARDLGYYTVLCDYLPDNPGQYVADKYYNASTTDIEAVYGIAKTEQVDGILAYASDPAALPAAIVAERLGLPTNPAKSVEILGVKHKFRGFLNDNGFACPKFHTFHPTDDIEEIKDTVKSFSFPIVVKPTDSSGSKGVTTLNGTEGLPEAIALADSYSRNKILIAEEFIHRSFPDVVGGDIFVNDGKIVLFGEMTCLRGEHGKGLVPIGERHPGGLSTIETGRIHDELQRLVTMLGIRFGELNIEILLDKDDNVHFLEVGPRAGGNMIPIQLSDAFGVDLIKANVAVAMGERPDFVDKPVKALPGCYMHYVLHSYEAGKFDGIEIDESIRKYVYREVIYKKQGDNVEVFDGAGKALGIIFLHFDTEEQMDECCSKIEKLVKVRLS